MTKEAVLVFANGLRREFQWTGEHTHYIPKAFDGFHKFKTNGVMDEKGRLIFREVTDG